MSALSQYWDRFVQSIVWRAFFGHFQFADWIVFAIVFMGMIYGIKKGFWKVFFDMLRLVFLIALTMEYDTTIGSYLERYLLFVPAGYMALLGFVFGGLVFWFILSFVIKQLRKMVSAKSSFMFNFLAGSTMGGIYLFLFLSFLFQLAIVSPWEETKRIYGGSHFYLGPSLAVAAPEVHRWTTFPFKWMSKKNAPSQSSSGEIP
ncbi:MAG: CvpA family protein [Candidatus Omnitrophica bacterium]|nr:CvpA family protein [Candidatus Omnitrophota bacterium]MDD5670612.1 CvpA family protein [Candidatus Omnitrophota bacterium]